jgi:hypothetical protein
MATVTYPGEASPAPAGAVITVSFLLDGQEYTAVNASVAKFDETICFLILCPPGTTSTTALEQAVPGWLASRGHADGSAIGAACPGRSARWAWGAAE